MAQNATRAQLLPLLDPKMLELILLPTEQCNFRCTYCYEDFSIGRMKSDTVAAVKRLIERRSEDLRTFWLTWFGGEPLAAKDVVFDIGEHATRLARQHGLNYTSNMTTNGYFLDAETLERLVACEVRSFQISLDGLGATHDQTRRRADHKGTFDRIWSNLLGVHAGSQRVAIRVRVHLHPHNIDSVDALTDTLIREFGADPRFDVIYRAVGNWGGPNSADIRALSRADGAKLRAEFEARWQNSRPQPAHTHDGAEDAPYVCYASRPNSLLIRADGRIGKCTVLLSDTRNTIGRISADGTLAFDAGGLDPWIRGFKSLDAGDLGCPAAKLPKQLAPQNLLTIQ